MKTVRLIDSTVVEVIPTYALPVEIWYGGSFAAQCQEAPDEVEQGWTFDGTSGLFSPPAPPEPVQATEMEDIDALLVDHEYRLTLMELGVTPDAV